jgi:predicted DNA-binding protein
MARPLEHGIFAGFRLPAEMNRALTEAASSLGVNRSEFVRAVISHALRDQDTARAAVDVATPPRPPFPAFSSR